MSKNDTSLGRSPPPPEGEVLAILRALTEQGAFLAMVREMEMGVVVVEVAGQAPRRLATVTRERAEMMAERGWILADEGAGRILRYRLTPEGRQELRRLIAQSGGGVTGGRVATGFAEGRAEFDGPRAVPESDGVVRHMRPVLADSPLAVLARRRDKDGKPFLARELVQAGERLREDFELSQMGPAVSQNWDSFLTETGAGPRITIGSGEARGQAPIEARDRVIAALRELGPGLADVALRCCCFLEGLESFESKAGWAARSGKIVLRISLTRLRMHYLKTEGRFGPMIG